MKITLTLIAIIVAVFGSAPAIAAPVELISNVFVEQRIIAEDGHETIKLLPAERVIPGDKLRFIITYKNAGEAAAGDFVITNPVPESVAYAGWDGDFPPVVSIDKGKSYGVLEALLVRTADGAERPARPDDVTHVQWKFANPIPGGGAGQVSFKAELR